MKFEIQIKPIKRGNNSMSDIIEMYEDPCDDCRHRVNAYCKAYKFPIKQLEISKCKRRKIRK